MPKRIMLRAVTAEEEAAIRQLAASRKAPARLVQRAKVIAAMLKEPGLTAGEAGLRAGYKSVGMGPMGVKRFNAEGLKGLDDRPRGGRRPSHPPEVRSALIGLALQKPRSSGYSFELWTPERLQKAFEERYGVHWSDSTIWTWMNEEGLQWKRRQSWFHEAERHDPEFVAKRGPSSRLTWLRPPGVCVMCVDEMGPLAVKTYPGEEWKAGPQRATFEPATGRATFVLSPHGGFLQIAVCCTTLSWSGNRQTTN